MKQRKEISGFNKLLPWMAGAGFALGHITLTSSCTLSSQGRCSTCGSCVIALGSIVAWAVLKKRNDNFYIDGQGRSE